MESNIGIAAVVFILIVSLSHTAQALSEAGLPLSPERVEAEIVSNMHMAVKFIEKMSLPVTLFEIKASGTETELDTIYHYGIEIKKQAEQSI